MLFRSAFAIEWKYIPMLAITHGQAASPTRLGKEIMVYADRLKEQYNGLISTPFSAKFGGATGNFNAHFVAYPNIDWVEFANEFVDDTLGLTRSQITTQVEHYDNLARLFDALKRINTILKISSSIHLLPKTLEKQKKYMKQKKIY